MPRKKPMPLRELEVCQRLRHFRIKTGLSQAQFAVLSRIHPRAYAGFEYARTQLNYRSAQKILSFWRNLSPVWLASGAGEIEETRNFSFPTMEELGIGERALFSNVFEERVKTRYGHAPILRRVGTWLPIRFFDFDPTPLGRLNNKEQIGGLIGGWIAELPDEYVKKFLDEIFFYAASIMARYPRDTDLKNVEIRLEQMREIEKRRRFPSAQQGVLELDLTKAESNVIAEGVKSEMALLLDRVKKAAAGEGKKTELAAFLGVDLASVSRWLSGKREPGGLITLKLLHWVGQQERQTKKP